MYEAIVNSADGVAARWGPGEPAFDEQWAEWAAQHAMDPHTPTPERPIGPLWLGMHAPLPPRRAADDPSPAPEWPYGEPQPCGMCLNPNRRAGCLVLSLYTLLRVTAAHLELTTTPPEAPLDRDGAPARAASSTACQ